MGHGYPLPSADSAIENSVDGDPVSCNCDKPWYNQGPGCYVALSGFIAGVSPDPTANFLQVSGTCDATASLQQTPPSRTPPSLQQTPPSLMSRSVVAPAPAPPGAFIQYYRVPNHADIAANMPTCDFWRPEDLGKKVPEQAHMGSAWMATFFGEAPAADWVQIQLKLLTSRSPAAPAPAPSGAFIQGSRLVDSVDELARGQAEALQPVRVEVITAADSAELQSVVSAANQLAAAAIEVPGCIRFDVMQQAKDTTFTDLMNTVWYYAVFADDAASKAFTASTAFGNFASKLKKMADASREITNYYLPPTMKTQLKAKDNTDPRILWFYGYLNDKTTATRDTLQTAFWKIVEPTRAEPGNLRYDQLIPASSSKFWMAENCWYRDLPDAQQAHMGSAWMATFFGEAPAADR